MNVDNLDATASWYNYSDNVIERLPFAATEQLRRLELVEQLRHYLQLLVNSYLDRKPEVKLQLDYYRNHECLRLEIPKCFLLKRINIEADSNLAMGLDFEKQFGIKGLMESIINYWKNEHEYNQELLKEKEYYVHTQKTKMG